MYICRIRIPPHHTEEKTRCEKTWKINFNTESNELQRIKLGTMAGPRTTPFVSHRTDLLCSETGSPQYTQRCALNVRDALTTMRPSQCTHHCTLNAIHSPRSRDPADIGYWKLRSLAWRAEDLAAGDSSKSRALPPRLLEGHDWNDEESEGWDDDDMWSEVANDLQTVPGAEAASAGIAPVPGDSGGET